MDHDPMCPAPRDWWRTCICDVIKKVRADQDQRNAARELTRMAQQDGLIP